MTDTEPKLQVWNTPDRARYFLFPQGVDLPKGALLVQRGPLTKRSVDEAVAAIYEVSTEEARDYINSQTGAAFAQLRGALDKLLTPRDGESKNPLPADPKDIFGVDAGEMFTDGEAAKEGLQNLLSFVGDAIRNKASDDDQRQVIQERFDKLKNDLSNPEGRVAQSFREAGKGLEKSIPKQSSKLDELADALKDAATKMRRERDDAETPDAD